ncbi:MAG: hypothetical protein GY851_27890 [bacterium]|nr:hypothetical protein [bacterium]
MIARRIAAMCSGDAPVTVADPDTDKPRPAEFGDVAMLFRSTTAVYLYERALKDHGVPYVVVAGTGFYERQEVTDLRNLLRVVTDPMDELALLGLLRGPIVGLSDDALVRLRHRGNLPLALCEEPLEDEPERDHLVACRGLLDDLRAHTEMRLPDFLRYVLQRTNYEAVLLGQGFLGVQKALNVRKVLDVADAFSATRTPRLAAFVRHMDDMTSEAIREGEASAQTAGAGAVTLMTIHKSKGLEFPIVFLPDLTRKSGQSTRSTTKKSGSGSLAPQVTDDTGSTVTPEVAKYLELDERELEAAEHARILYVAMTRARDWLVLSGSPGAKGSKSSWFADLDALFCFTGAPDGEGRTGDSWRATVRREVPEAAVPRSTGESTPSPSSDVLHARANLVTPTHTTRRTFSVTELLPLMADGTVPDDPVASAPNSPINAAFRGTLTHRFFELWDFMQAGVPPVAEFLRRECPDARFHKMLEPSLEATANRFMETPLYAVLRDQKQLQREQPFTLRVDDALVTGVIDAVLDDGSLVDYKTGRPSPRKESQYHLQLHLYAASLKRIRNVEACAAHLCYLDEESPGSMVCNIGLTESSAEDAMNRASVAIRQLRDGG